MVETILVVRLD